MVDKLWVGTDSGNEGDWGTAANWSPSGVPINSDVVYLANSTQSVTDTLDQSAVTLTALFIDQSFTGAVGTTSAYLQIGATTCTIGRLIGNQFPAGSTLLKLDLGAVQSACTVHNTSSTSADLDRPPVRLLTNQASTTLTVRRGFVGLAVDEPTETSTLATVNCDFVTSQQSDAQVQLGSGVTLTTLNKFGGTCWLNSAATTVVNYAGALIIDGAGAITTLSIHDGSIDGNSSGTITTLNGFGGAVNLLQTSPARTITTLNVFAGFNITYDPSIVTITNKPDPQERVLLSASAV